MSEKLLAFEVEVNGFITIVFAATAAKAKWRAIRGYWAAYGRRHKEWPEVKCRRERLYDSSPLAKHSPHYYSPSYVRGYP